MSQSVRIRKKVVLKRVLCRHKLITAFRASDKKSDGIQLYKICINCGRVKKLRYVTSANYKNYEWSNIHMFVDTKKSVRILVNDNVRGINE